LAVALTDAASGAGDRDGLAPYIVYAAKLYTCQVLVGSTVDRQLRRHVSRTSNAIVMVIIDGGS